jgi:nucleoside-diphosphate-sugar epimerase
MDAVVLGGAGFIGSNLVRRLVAEGLSVRAVDIEAPTPERAVAMSGCEFWQTDVRDPLRTTELVSDARWVFHLAADMGGVGYFHKYDYYPAMDNMQMTMNVLRACESVGTERLFYASSACIYPTELQRSAKHTPVLYETEAEQGTPDQMYGREKLFGLRLCERAPLDARVGILHTVYGPLQEHEGERMKFPAAICRKALRLSETDNTLHIWGDGSQMRSYLYIDDAIERIWRIMSADTNHGPTNVGATGAVSCNAVARMVAHLVGAVDVQFQYEPAEPTGVMGRDCSNAKFERHHGTIADTSLEDGFASFLDWMRPLVAG